MTFNEDATTHFGPEESLYPTTFARRDIVDQHIKSNQRLVGVFGWTRLADSMLRSVGLILAEGK